MGVTVRLEEQRQAHVCDGPSALAAVQYVGRDFCSPCGQHWASCTIGNGIPSYGVQSVAYSGILFGGVNKFSWGHRTERTGIWSGSPLVRGSGGSCNLAQEIPFHIVKCLNFWYFKTIYDDNQFMCHCYCKIIANLGSFRILLPFFRTSWGFGVLNSAIFKVFTTGLSLARFWRAFGIWGGFEPPKPPSVCHWVQWLRCGADHRSLSSNEDEDAWSWAYSTSQVFMT